MKKLTLIVLFLRYDTAKYPGAYERLKGYLEAIHGISWRIFRIDNKKPFSNVLPVGAETFELGGDNSCWEFSGWRLGLEKARNLIPEYDGVLFVNDAFEVSGPSFLSRLSHTYITWMLRLGIPVGGLDRVATPGELAGRPFSVWIRSNCFLLNRHCVERINLVSVDESGIDFFVDRQYGGAYFKENAPISQELREHLVLWLSMYWHSAFCPEDNWELFRNKTRAILNEWLLGQQIIDYSRYVFDHRPFLWGGLPRAVRTAISGVSKKSVKGALKRVIKAVLPKPHLQRLKNIIYFFINKIVWLQEKRLARKMQTPSKHPRVVLLEPNETHAEVLPGFAWYFVQMGYDVHVILRPSMAREQPFCRMNAANLHLHTCSRFGMHFLYDMLGAETELVMLTSSFVFDIRGDYFFLELHDEFSRTQYGTVAVLHNAEEQRPPRMRLLTDERRVITLRPLPSLPHAFAVAPLFFGQTARRVKGGRTHFIVVGATDKHRRDYGLLYRSVRMLLRLGVTDFHVALAGINTGLCIPLELQKHITITGRLSFPELYAQVEHADFILPLLNDACISHTDYIHKKASGTRQLMFGFCKPCVIQTPFAAAFGVTAEHALIYEKNNLADAMRAAIAMDRQRYDNLSDALCALRIVKEEESAASLRYLIEHLSAHAGGGTC